MNSSLIPTKTITFKTIAIIFFIFVNLFTLYRIQYGVNFFDEAFYAIGSMRFVLGQKLFIHELGLAQTSALLTYPLVKLHFLIWGGTEGIIYSLRLAHWILYLGLGLLIFKVLKQFISANVSLIIAGSCGLFLPGGLPTVSYNTLGTLFLTLGLFSIFKAANPRKPYIYFVSGILMGLCSLSYITFFSIAIFMGIAIFIFIKPKKPVLFYFLGWLSIVILPGVLALMRIEEFRNCLSFAQNIEGSTNRIGRLPNIIHKFFPKTVLMTLSLWGGSCLFTYKSKSKYFFVLIIFIPILALILSELSYGKWAVYSFYLAILGFIPWLCLPKSKLIVDLTRWVFIPSFLAGVIASMTSALGHLNAQVGLVPAALVSLVFMSEILKRAPSGFSIPSFLSLGLPILLILPYPITIWDETPRVSLTDRISFGPYRGLYTSPEKRTYLETVSRDILTYISSKNTLFIYPNFQAGYLIAGVPPLSGILWYQPGYEIDKILVRLYEKEANLQSRILRMNVWYAHPTMRAVNFFDENSPLINLIHNKHHPVKETQWLSVFVPNTVTTRANQN